MQISNVNIVGENVFAFKYLEMKCVHSVRNHTVYQMTHCVLVQILDRNWQQKMVTFFFVVAGRGEEINTSLINFKKAKRICQSANVPCHYLSIPYCPFLGPHVACRV